MHFVEFLRKLPKRMNFKLVELTCKVPTSPTHMLRAAVRRRRVALADFHLHCVALQPAAPTKPAPGKLNTKPALPSKLGPPAGKPGPCAPPVKPGLPPGKPAIITAAAGSAPESPHSEIARVRQGLGGEEGSPGAPANKSLREKARHACTPAYHPRSRPRPRRGVRPCTDSRFACA